MNELLRTAIVGTGQLAASDTELTGTPLDGLVAQVEGLDRERALLLRAGGLALLNRSARPLLALKASLEPADAETLRLPSPRLTSLLSSLLSESNDALLIEACQRMERAGMRLPEQLLPAALSRSGAELRQHLQGVLGARGVWLAKTKRAWAWALGPSAATVTLPPDVETRWEDGGQAERRALLSAARHAEPALARKLIAVSWKQEKAEQRLAWVELLTTNLSDEDEPLLTGMLTDRSSQVRNAAARLLWSLPNSELALRVRALADGLVTLKGRAVGVLGKLKTLVGAPPPSTLEVELPADTYDASWEKDGIIEAAPQGVGRRQWWLGQMLSAVPPEHWVSRFGVSAEELVQAALTTEHWSIVLDGLSSAAVRHRAVDWYAPLWDAWLSVNVQPVLTSQVMQVLSARLTPEQAEPRMLALFDQGRTDLLDCFRRPWPRAVATQFLSGMTSYRPEWTALFEEAAMAIPSELLPMTVTAPEVAENDYRGQAYLRALERFLSTASARRAIAEEMTP